MGNESEYEEWYFQSDYDLETAFDMFHSGRYVYCIFMSLIMNFFLRLIKFLYRPDILKIYEN